MKSTKKSKVYFFKFLNKKTNCTSSFYDFSKYVNVCIFKKNPKYIFCYATVVMFVIMKNYLRIHCE